MTQFLGHIRKMTSSLENGQVSYRLPLDDQQLDLMPLIGQKLILKHTGHIHCQECGKKTKKSYSQGFCYPCMTKLAKCDMCIMKPETCHFDQGTCREPQWGEDNCFVPHYVYLANTTAIKVGITRHTQIPTRWIDQGANQALPLFKVSSRLQSGLVEIALAEFISDKTNWRNMLKGKAQPIDLQQKANELIPLIEEKLSELQLRFGEDAIEKLNAEVVEIDYPVTQYPTKITSLNFDKTPELGGVLLGIKGQYLYFDTGVINMRKFTSYEICAEF
ncbi:hypothetical protein VHA01S_005_01510 [Vibrio halioticoli NBRC 102217]|uniref:DUF2797 domain-containing protein n=1 Tax=Vibrio halioticoli NBRC 102217 TaxID=1219072 RepID=V5FHQ5_9VIBR|nr:DUF2797 domain-containing protein [Vibrio halioticoli]GAD88547.1 hypothetical protein VHA01S_005_01510 [Vibrio halioticoli NBRC 102217]